MKQLVTALLVMMTVTCSMAETPQEGASAILALIKARNYQELFPTRYSEWSKVEAEGVPVDKAVAKLSGIFEKSYPMMVTAYEQLAKAEFTLGKSETVVKGETGDIASTDIVLGERKIPFKLYKMESGKWGFRL